METGLYADEPGTVKAVHVQPGAQVDAKDLLVELATPIPEAGRCGRPARGTSTCAGGGRSGAPTGPPGAGRAAVPRHPHRGARGRHGHLRRHGGRCAVRRRPRRGGSTAAARCSDRRRRPPRSCSSRSTSRSSLARHGRPRRRRVGLAALPPRGHQPRGAHRRTWHSVRSRRRPSLYLAGNLLGPGELREEAAARRAAGDRRALPDAGELREAYGLEREGAIESHGNLALDPRKLTAGLLRPRARRGARLYAPVEAVRTSRIEQTGSRW